MGKQKPKTKTSATVRVHFGVAKAEASGYRYFIERQGRLTRGSRRIRILDSKWYRTQAEAQRGLRGARRRWIGKL